LKNGVRGTKGNLKMVMCEIISEYENVCVGVDWNKICAAH
jgi:hypothetical protein